MPVSQAITSYEAHFDILVSSDYLAFTYTLDQTGLSDITMVDGSTRKVLPEGTVMSYDPALTLVVPHTTEAAGTIIGPLLQMADATDGDVEVAILWRGDVRLDRIYDNEVLGTLTANAATAFGDRIKVHPSNRP